MNIKSTFIVAACMAISTALNAQFIQDVNGRPLRETNYTDVDGSPYLSRDWAKAVVKFNDGETYKDIDIKYDQISDGLVFKNKDGATLEFVKPVASFKITYLTDGKQNLELYQNGFEAIDGNTTDSYYTVLADGSTKLLKKTKKSILESKPYNSATTLKTFQQQTHYYITDSTGHLKRIKPDKKTFLSYLPDKSVELEKFAKENKIDFKNDADLGKFITYYNSIK